MVGKSIHTIALNQQISGNKIRKHHEIQISDVFSCCCCCCYIQTNGLKHYYPPPASEERCENTDLPITQRQGRTLQHYMGPQWSHTFLKCNKETFVRCKTKLICVTLLATSSSWINTCRACVNLFFIAKSCGIFSNETYFNQPTLRGKFTHLPQCLKNITSGTDIVQWNHIAEGGVQKQTLISIHWE